MNKTNRINAAPLFPVFHNYLDLVYEEIDGLSNENLDWVSTKWNWANWSIKDNLSHVSSHLFRWYLLRWGSCLFPTKLPFEEELHFLAGLPSRRLEPTRWGTIETILCKLEQSLELVQEIIRKETPESVLTKSIFQGGPGFYGRIAGRYPGTQYQDPNDPSLWHLTLEGTLHHSEGELITHLFNVQRLKLAQGLDSRVTLPNIGYWTLPDWDRSLP